MNERLIVPVVFGVLFIAICLFYYLAEKDEDKEQSEEIDESEMHAQNRYDTTTEGRTLPKEPHNDYTVYCDTDEIEKKSDQQVFMN
jgi:hypothetical protein